MPDFGDDGARGERRQILAIAFDPLADAPAAHRRTEMWEHIGKIVLDVA